MLLNLDFSRDTFTTLNNLGVDLCCSLPGRRTFNNAPVNYSIFKDFLSIANGLLKFNRPASMPMDTSPDDFNGLKPRIEMRTRSLDQRKQYEILYSFKFDKIPREAKVHIAQILTRTAERRPAPTIQIKAYSGKLWVEYKNLAPTTFKFDGGRLFELTSITIGKTYNIRIRYYGDQTNGRVRVYLDGVKKFERTGLIAGMDSAKTAFGIYGYPGCDIKMSVQKFSIAQV